MITDKSIVRRSFLFFSVLLLLLLASVGCSRSGDGNYESLLGDLGGEEEGEADYEKYLVIIRDDSSELLLDAVNEFCDELEEKTETEVVLRYESDPVSVGDDTCKILVGKLDRPESRIFFKGYKSDDFGYEYSEGLLIVGGINEPSTVAALRKLADDKIAYADKEHFMNIGTSCFYGGDYEVGEVLLNGFELSEYIIVYGDKATDMLEVAEELSREIENKTGYCLDVSSDKNLKYETRSICIGDTELFKPADIILEKNSALISTYKYGIVLSASERYGFDVCSDMLMQMLCEINENRNVDLWTDDDINLSFISSKLSVLKVKADEADLDVDSLVLISDILNDRSVDIVEIDGISSGSLQYIEQGITVGYLAERIAGDDACASYCLYADERIGVLSSDTSELLGGSSSAISFEIDGTDIEFCIAELYSDTPEDIDSALSAAETANSFVISNKPNTVFLYGNFVGDAEKSFSAGLDESVSVNSLVGADQENDNSIPLYLSGYAFGALSYEETERNDMKLSLLDIELYGREKI